MCVDRGVGSASLFPSLSWSFKRETKLSRQCKSRQGEDTVKTGQATYCLPCRACLSPSITAGTLGSEGLAGLDHHPPPSLPGFKLSLRGGTGGGGGDKASLGRDTLTLLTTGLDGPVDRGLSYCPHQRSSSDPGEKFKSNSAQQKKCSFCISGSLFLVQNAGQTEEGKQKHKHICWFGDKGKETVT